VRRINPLDPGARAYTDLMKTEALKTALDHCDVGLSPSARSATRKRGHAKGAHSPFRSADHPWDPEEQLVMPANPASARASILRSEARRSGMKFSSQQRAQGVATTLSEGPGCRAAQMGAGDKPRPIFYCTATRYNDTPLEVLYPSPERSFSVIATYWWILPTNRP
jgi:hypothetical protein